MKGDSYYSYHSNNRIAWEGEPYEISDYEPNYNYSRYDNYASE